MQRHHHQDQRFGGPEGRRLGGEHSSHMQSRDDHGRFNGRDDRDDRNDIHRSDYGDDRSGYRSNDNARYGGGYQAGASSGEGASYGGRDWYAGGAGDNRGYSQSYERGERGYQRDFEDRGYRDDRSNYGYRTDRDFGGYNRGYGNPERGGYASQNERGYNYGDNRGYGYGNDRGYGSNDRGYGNDRGFSNDRSSGYGGSGADYDRNDTRRFGGYEGRSRGGYESSHMQQRDDEGRFAGRDRYEDDRGWPRGRR